MKVIDPDGHTWRISRRWVPWRRTIRSIDDLGGAGDPFGGIDDLGGLIVVLVLLATVVVLAIVAPWLLVGIAASFEFLVALLVLPVAVLGRVVFGRQWHVEVRRGFTPWTERATGDWAESRIAIHRAAEAIRRGEIPPRSIPAVRWGRVVDDNR